MNKIQSKISIKKQATLRDIQDYVLEMEKERGFSDNSVIEECLMLGEEVGELFKSIRKNQNLTIDQNSKFASTKEELADILIFLCAIANRLDIDLEKSLRDKEDINKNRSWLKKDH